MLTSRKLIVLAALAAVIQGAAVGGLVYGAYRFAVYQGWVKEIK